jgi:tetratricopeptide (TPR) repeat protein
MTNIPAAWKSIGAVVCIALFLSASTDAQVVYCNGVRYWGACPPPPGPTPADLERQRKEQEAKAEKERGIREEARMHEANDYGASLYEQGRYQDAIIAFNEALEHSPGDPVILENIQKAKGKLRASQALREAEAAREHSSAAIPLANNREAGMIFDESGSAATQKTLVHAPTIRSSTKDTYTPEQQRVIHQDVKYQYYQAQQAEAQRTINDAQQREHQIEHERQATTDPARRAQLAVDLAKARQDGSNARTAEAAAGINAQERAKAVIRGAPVLLDSPR